MRKNRKVGTQWGTPMPGLHIQEVQVLEFEEEFDPVLLHDDDKQGNEQGQ